MTTMEIKFFYNGFKVNKGPLVKTWYSKGGYTPESGIAEGTITIYARSGSCFPKELNQVFNIQNDTDIMTDYFEEDRIFVSPTHPLYSDVLAAWDKAKAKHAA